jgi:mono/diheme cytochrome c family protein
MMLLLILGASCDQGLDVSTTTPATPATPAAPISRPAVSSHVLALGEKVYQLHCATCHGQQAEGDPNWRQMGEDGRFPPPPLNGSGHAWHHPTPVLVNVIKSGSPDGQGNMPAWGDTLSDDEILAVIDWFKSLWPQPAYEA